jgi:hypothetical protein
MAVQKAPSTNTATRLEGSKIPVRRVQLGVRAAYLCCSRARSLLPPDLCCLTRANTRACWAAVRASTVAAFVHLSRLFGCAAAAGPRPAQRIRQGHRVARPAPSADRARTAGAGPMLRPADRALLAALARLLPPPRSRLVHRRPRDRGLACRRLEFPTLVPISAGCCAEPVWDPTVGQLALTRKTGAL